MGIESIKEHLQPVIEKLKGIRSHDEYDHWLINEIGFKDEDYFRADHVLIGCPQHEGVQRNNGRIGAAEAPDKIREHLYKLQMPEDSGIKIYDAGNIKTDIFNNLAEEDILNEKESSDALNRIHDALTKSVEIFLNDGKNVIVLGGGNDISFADVRALSNTVNEISVVNVDAHLDMRIAGEMTSGSPYRKLVEGNYLKPENFYEFGIRKENNSKEYLKEAENQGTHTFFLPDILKEGVATSFKKVIEDIGDKSFFFGLDMDVIQAADAPGVSASSPIGLTGREVIDMVYMARQKENMRILEVTETNPTYDIDDRTVKLVSQIIYCYLLG
ncbi:formimidoylglutamase [Gracilimonas sp. Q87]|uniref:formimidoylglutamase n=1 Tax=Gracilimonas sp. Q87 TaxID=3384766 RepID=UPI003984317B